MYGDATLDVSIVASHFDSLPPETRDILLIEYIEVRSARCSLRRALLTAAGACLVWQEISAQVVGASRVYAFFRHCFRGQGYHVTKLDEPLHELWEYA